MYHLIKSLTNVSSYSEVLLHLTNYLKKSFNDHEVEKQMIKRSKIYTIIFVFIVCGTLLSYGIDALFRGMFSSLFKFPKTFVRKYRLAYLNIFPLYASRTQDFNPPKKWIS